MVTLRAAKLTLKPGPAGASMPGVRRPGFLSLLPPGAWPRIHEGDP